MPRSVLYRAVFKKSLLQQPIKLENLIKHAASLLGLIEGQRNCCFLNNMGGFLWAFCFLERNPFPVGRFQIVALAKYGAEKGKSICPNCWLDNCDAGVSCLPKMEREKEAMCWVPFAVQYCMHRNALFNHGWRVFMRLLPMRWWSNSCQEIFLKG